MGNDHINYFVFISSVVIMSRREYKVEIFDKHQ